MTSRTSVTCDLSGCEEQKNGRNQAQWINVIPPRRAGALPPPRYPDPLDFCSWSHLAEFALAQPVPA